LRLRLRTNRIRKNLYYDGRHQVGSRNKSIFVMNL
jgi:hypothetical protein